ncbi:hypothetical protein RJ639_005994 [Escallonia herrerae]|uniref:Fe2OG dioxygenase domain-containing protein n=1 Tax=Escallonia herrerae TaxID=1293975 RepID=A0AA89AW49_9ASTE|nr:hypothetical protein RJ639_005994 [Escallonia herrerae]
MKPLSGTTSAASRQTMSEGGFKLRSGKKDVQIRHLVAVITEKQNPRLIWVLGIYDTALYFGRTRVDLRTQVERRPVGGPRDGASIQVKTSPTADSITQLPESSLPTSFRKKRASSSYWRPKLHQAYHAVQNSNYDKGLPVVEPFVMGHFESRKPANCKPLLHKECMENWTEKEHPTEDTGPLLRAPPEQRLDGGPRDDGSFQFESSASDNSTSKQDESSLPTNFGKSHVSSSNRRFKHQSYPEHMVGFRSSGSGRDLPMVETFDICLSGRRKSSKYKPSLTEKNNGNKLEHCIIETGQMLRPGMVLLKSYVTLSKQVNIVKKCQELGLGPGGFYQPGYQDGAKLRLQMMCLGKRWDPQTKYEERLQNDYCEPPGIPNDFSLLVKKALEDSHALIMERDGARNVEDILPGMSPDICIVNFYTTNGRLGLHQDRDESPQSLDRGLPVVSISIGDSAEFLYGDKRNYDKAEKVLLESGDVLIFGGKSRQIFHGVKSIIPNSAPPGLLRKANIRPGRLNLTFRQF